MRRRTFLALLASCVSERALAQATVVQTCGSAALTAGRSHHVTVDVNGQSCQSGAAPTHSAQALAYLARTVGGNEGGNATNIATLIDGLVADGVWSKLDALYVLAQQNGTDALLNLIGTSYSLSASLVATQFPVVFTAYQGFKSFSTGISTGFTPSTAPSPKYTQNSASFGAWAYNLTGTTNTTVIGAVTANTGVLPWFSSNIFYADINGRVASPTSPQASGWYVAETNATNNYAYYNGASLLSGANVPISVPTVVMTIGNFPAGGYAFPYTISAAYIGASLGAAGQLALYNRLRTYMTAVGVP